MITQWLGWRACSENVTPYVDEAIEKITDSAAARTSDLIEKLHEKRSGQKRLRDFLLEQSYEATAETKPPEELYQIAAAIELYNQSTYMNNWMLDDKGELEAEQDGERAAVAAMHLYDQARETISSIDSLSSELETRIQQELTEINKAIYKGQNDDLDTLSAEQNAHELPEGEYETLYERMCQRKCGRFSAGITSIGALLGDSSEEEREALHTFGNALGTGLQMVNDVADNIPLHEAASVERPYKDQFSDFENGLVTRPIYELLNAGPEAYPEQDSFHEELEPTDYLNADLSDDDKARLFLHMLTTNSFDASMRKTRSLKEHVAKPALREAFSKEQRRRLSQMTALLDSTSIYRVLRDEYDYELE